MRRLRALGAAVVAAVALAVTAPPAAAVPTAFAFEGTMEIGCFGCGTYGPDGNSASLTGVGVVAGRPAAPAAGSMTFTIDSPTGLGCVAAGSIEGWLTLEAGWVATWRFTIDIVAPDTALMAVPSLNAWGPVEYRVTSPVGNPCGAAVVIQFAGELVGA